MNHSETDGTLTSTESRPPASTTRRGPRSLTARHYWLLAAVSVVTIAIRLADSSLPNLGTMIALTLLTGTVFRHPVGMLLPLAVRGLTDVLVYVQTGYSFFPSWPFDYSAYLLIFLLGLAVPASAATSGGITGWIKRILAVASATSGGILAYFLLSNFGVWYIWPDTYPHTPAGLLDCFAKGLPFAKGTILGNLAAAPVFYAAWYVLVLTEQQPAGSVNAAEERATV